MPLAYFITFTTYGVWLHGREIGSVDKQHNELGSPFLPPDPIHEAAMRSNMKEPPYLLDDARRAVVLETIREVARHRGWHLLACDVRTNHVHIVVAADAKPEKIMSDFKAYASRRLKERLGEPADCKRWTQHGSTRYLWTEEQVAAAVEYTVSGQGAALAVFDGRSACQWPFGNEPKAPPLAGRGRRPLVSASPREGITWGWTGGPGWTPKWLFSGGESGTVSDGDSQSAPFANASGSDSDCTGGKA